MFFWNRLRTGSQSFPRENRSFVLRSLGYDYDFQTNHGFQLDNRGKRSITFAIVPATA